MNTNDPTTVCMLIFLVTTILFALASVREHHAGQEALRLALHDQRTAENLSAALNRCVQDKQYSDQLDQDAASARDARNPISNKLSAGTLTSLS